ncbi:MAG: polysaccharide deacetylase [Osedax symbiont Rs2]|nr:MAG: polysaccharide deacetylase [Osedax symbiont Rs2]
MYRKPRIYMLHRIIEHFDENNYYFQRKTAISWLRFVALLDLIEKNGWETKPTSILASGYTDNDVFITFDDGYTDNNKALDELIRRGMTATIYPVKDFALTGFSPIDDMAHHLMSIQEPPPSIRRALLDGRLKKLLRDLTVTRYRHLRKHWFGIDFDAYIGHLFMNEQQLMHYYSQGIELGIHGRSHRAFNHLTAATLESELSDSLVWLQLLGVTTPVSICFPHGKHNEQVITKCLSIGQTLLGVDCEMEFIQVFRRIHVKEECYG